MIYFDGIIFSWQKGGGVYRYFVELISGLNKNKISTKVYLQKPNLGFPLSQNENLIIEKISLCSLNSDNFSKTKRKIFSPINKFLLGHKLKKLSSGIFHSTYFTTYKNLNIPQVLTVHDMTYESFPEYFYSSGAKRHIKSKKDCIDNADKIICVSESTKLALISEYPYLKDSAEQKICVIHHGVNKIFNKNYNIDLAENLKKRFNISKPFFLFVGKKGTYKNFEFLNKAFQNWDKKDSYQLITVGDNQFITEEELKTLYCISKAFVFPSLDEGFGFPILEAICCGTHVLASDIPVFREIGLNIPIFFNPKDTTSLLTSFDQIHYTPDLSDTDKTNNENKVRAKFSWDKCVNETIKVYKSLS